MSNTQNQWIPVSERLPNYGERMKLVLSEGCYRFASPAKGGEWEEAFSGGVLRHVTHWMDLPEPPAPPKPADDLIKKLVDAFLAWPLPESVCSDGCVTMQGYPHRSGTNLLTAIEAQQMFVYLLAKVPFAKLMPDFETFARKCRHANGEWLQFDGDRIVTRECALFIWNAAQGKPEA